jgi:hypothetical protein
VLVVVQLSPKPLLFDIAAVGEVVFNVVVALAVAVHPFEPVTVTVNVPAIVMLVEAVVAPFDHR